MIRSVTGHLGTGQPVSAQSHKAPTYRRPVGGTGAEHALAPWLLDIQLNPDERGAWVSRRDRSFVRPLDQVTWVADHGVRYVNPEIALIFKARLARPKDEVDLRRAMPLLRSDQVDQIRAHVQQAAPEHRWLPLLTADAGRPDPGGR
jgi:hypothetical protein